MRGIANLSGCHSGMVRKHRTSGVQLHPGNPEIPGSMLRIASERRTIN